MKLSWESLQVFWGRNHVVLFLTHHTDSEHMFTNRMDVRAIFFLSIVNNTYEFTNVYDAILCNNIIMGLLMIILVYNTRG